MHGQYGLMCRTFGSWGDFCTKFIVLVLQSWMIMGSLFFWGRGGREGEETGCKEDNV